MPSVALGILVLVGSIFFIFFTAGSLLHFDEEERTLFKHVRNILGFILIPLWFLALDCNTYPAGYLIQDKQLSVSSDKMDYIVFGNKIINLNKELGRKINQDTEMYLCQKYYGRLGVVFNEQPDVLTTENIEGKRIIK